MKIKYRVISDGVWCYPQHKFLLWWCNFDYGNGDVQYDTVEECVEFIKRHKVINKKKKIRVVWSSDQTSEL